jgi:hypothetical protein
MMNRNEPLFYLLSMTVVFSRHYMFYLAMQAFTNEVSVQVFPFFVGVSTSSYVLANEPAAHPTYPR